MSRVGLHLLQRRFTSLEVERIEKIAEQHLVGTDGSSAAIRPYNVEVERAGSVGSGMRAGKGRVCPRRLKKLRPSESGDIEGRGHDHSDRRGSSVTQ